MALFTSQLLTAQGEALAAKALGGKEMQFTRIALGDGQLSGQSPVELTGLIGEKVSLPVQESYREDNSTWTVGAAFDNKDLQVGFYWRETGVFALDPDVGEVLFSYSSAQNAPDYIPPLTGGRWEKRIYISERVAGTANVVVDASGSVLYLPREDFVQHLQSPLHTYPATAALTPSGVLELTGDLPAEKDGLTVQFVSPAPATDGLQVQFAGSETLYPILSTAEGKEPVTAGAWDQGVPVSLTFSGGNSYRSGGGSTKVFSLSLPVSGWSGETAPYTQTVAAPGLLASDRPHLGIAYTGDSAQQAAQAIAGGCITRLVAEAGQAVFTCFFTRPAVDLSILLEVIR